MWHCRLRQRRLFIRQHRSKPLDTVDESSPASAGRPAPERGARIETMAFFGLATKDDVEKAKKQILHAISELAKRKPRAVSLLFAFGLVRNKEKVKPMPAETTLTNEQKVHVTLTPVTDTGKPAKLDGSPSWSIISGNSQVVVADDGLSADLISADDPGDTEVLVKADADLGEGVQEISD